MVAGAKRGLSGSGGLCPFLWERPSADQVNNTVSVPLSFDVNRYFKPLWKPGLFAMAAKTVVTQRFILVLRAVRQKRQGFGLT